MLAYMCVCERERERDTVFGLCVRVCVREGRRGETE